MLADWLAQSRVARGFARRPAGVDVARARRWVESCDGPNGLLLAIRSINDATAGGFWHVLSERSQRRAEVTVVLGRRLFDGRAAAVETGIMLFDWLLRTRGVEKLTSTILATNRPALRLADQWMIREGVLRGEIMAPGTGERLDVIRFGLLAQDWTGRKR